MSIRSSLFGRGAPGGAVEYRGDLVAPITSYASTTPHSALTSRLGIQSSTNVNGSAVVNRQEQRGGIRSFYSHGGYRMPNALPFAGNTATGGVNRSAFQQTNIQLMDWQINPSWHQAGYPRNLALSTRVSQLQTNVNGAPGASSQDPRPLFTRVQTVERARIIVQSYKTRGAR